MESTLQLPSFDRPPLTEVVLGVQFERLPKLTAGRIGQLWKLFVEEFPDTEDQPPLQPINERFGEIGPQAISFQLVSAYQPPRSWFINTSKTKLIQVQSDRFLLNWRKSSEIDKYPRFFFIEKDFREKLALFVKFAHENGIGEFRPEYCELTYINHIPSNELWQSHGDADIIYPFCTFLDKSVRNIRLEQSGFNLAYEIQGSDKRPVGRLRINSEPKFLLSDGKPIYSLELAARGTTIGSKDIAGISRFLDLAHREIVLSFAAITSKNMHRYWGRNDISSDDK